MAGLASAPILLDVREYIEQWSLLGGCPMAQPYLDDDLVEFTARLPRELFFYGGYRRGLFRHAMRGILPEPIRLREDKSSFFAALGETIAAFGGARALEPLCTGSLLAAEGWVDAEAFRAAVSRLDQSPFDASHAFALWPFIAVEAFLRMMSRGAAS